jgi:hypothetical protein
LAQLTEFLRSELHATPPLIELHPVGEGSNHKTHLVALDSGGSSFGLKAVSGHPSKITGELFTAHHILLLAGLSLILDVPTPIRCFRLPAIQGLGPLDGWPVVVRRWHGMRLDKLSAEEIAAIRGSPETFLRQYGEWFTFGLIFGLFDGKVKNWTWQPEDQSLGRFDLEACFYPHTVPAGQVPIRV